MSAGWLLLVPLGYLGAAAALSPGLRRQPCLVRAGTPDRFKRELDAAGGPDAVRRGLWLDAGFVVLVVGVCTPLLTADGWYAVPLVAGGLDLAESLLLAPMLTRTPSPRRTRALAALALLKLSAYGVLLVALGVALTRSA